MDSDPLAAAAFAGQRHHRVPPYADEAYLPALERILDAERAEAASVIVPNTDRDCRFFAPRQSWLAARGWLALVPGAEIVAALDDKLASFHLFRERGIPTPETWSPEDIPHDVFPLVVKPRSDSGSRGVFVAQTLAQARALAEYVGDAVVQPRIPGREYTVDAVGDLEGRVAALVPRERLRVRAGVAVASRTVRDPELLALARRAADVVGFRGPGCVQIIREQGSGRLFVIEANSRLGGGVLASVAAGLDLPGLVRRIALGERIEYAEDAYEAGVTTLHHLQPITLGPGEADD